MRVVTPVRSTRCKHLECFDLASYLQMARASKFPKYTCPRCSSSARPHELRLDPWMQQLLGEVPTSCFEVEVQPDGSFSAVTEKPTPASRKRKAETVAVD